MSLKNVDAKNLKVLYVSRHDPANMSSWSGTPHFIYEEISNHCQTINVCNPRSYAWFRLLSKVVKKIFQLTGNPAVDLTRTSFYSKAVGKEVTRCIQENQPDLVVGVAASIELAYVETDTPIIHISDATFAAMIGYYPEFSNIFPYLEAQGNLIENRVLQRANAIICSSQWASKSATDFYGVSSEKTFTVLLGANVKNLPSLTDEMINAKFDGPCKLLFIGKEWHRKGGDIALDVFRNLKKSGVDVELTVVSDQFEGNDDEDGLTVQHGINKGTVEGLALFNKLFEEASFFLLPTQAEAFGLVYAEAAAFGCIAVGPDTGGVADIIDDTETGILMPTVSSPDEYAERIEKLWSDKVKLTQMSCAARLKFDTQLSWSHWGKNFSEIASKLVKQ